MNVKQISKGVWRATVSVGQQPAQRCYSDACTKTFERAGKTVTERPLWWCEDGRKRSACPNCGGELTDVSEWRQRTITGRTKKEVLDVIAKAHTVRKEGGEPFPERMTMRDLTSRWLAASDLRPKTRKSYEEKMRLHVLSRIGKVEAAALKRHQVRDVIDGVTMKGLSQQTAKHVHRALYTCLNWALEEQIIRRHPMAGMKPPKVAKPDLLIPTPEQMNALIDAAEGTRWFVPMVLSVACGLRRSEVLALGWDQVDFDRATLRVTRTVHWTKADGLHWLEPKSENSRRVIPIPPFALKVLKAHKASQVASIQRLVCHDEAGQAIVPDRYSEAFLSLARAAGLPDGTTLHDVRHGWVTALAMKGVPILTVSRLAGHSTAAFTLDVYGHLFPADAEVAATAIEEALGR